VCQFQDVEKGGGVLESNWERRVREGGSRLMFGEIAESKKVRPRRKAQVANSRGRGNVGGGKLLVHGCEKKTN